MRSLLSVPRLQSLSSEIEANLSGNVSHGLSVGSLAGFAFILGRLTDTGFNRLVDGFLRGVFDFERLVCCDIGGELR